MALIELLTESSEIALSVRRFSVEEEISRPFSISVWARATRADVQLDAIAGRAVGLRLVAGEAGEQRPGHAHAGGVRVWTGICREIVQLEASPGGLSSYLLAIVPALWLLSQRRNHRIFQHLTAPQIVARVLEEWRIEPLWAISVERYPKLEYKVQYGETDLDFVSRLLEEAGIAYLFADDREKGSILVFDDALDQGALRRGSPLPFVDRPTRAAGREWVTRVQVTHEVRPGTYAIRDHDFRHPSYLLYSRVSDGRTPMREVPYEQYHYAPNALWVEVGGAKDTPHADDQGVARASPEYGEAVAARALFALRADKRRVRFVTGALDLSPGTVFSIADHPRAEISHAPQAGPAPAHGPAHGPAEIGRAHV